MTLFWTTMYYPVLFKELVAVHCYLVSLSQTKRKCQAGLGQSQEHQPRPSEERGRHFRPERETSRLQEADPAGPERGTHHFFY